MAKLSETDGGFNSCELEVMANIFEEISKKFDIGFDSVEFIPFTTYMKTEVPEEPNTIPVPNFLIDHIENGRFDVVAGFFVRYFCNKVEARQEKTWRQKLNPFGQDGIEIAKRYGCNGYLEAYNNARWEFAASYLSTAPSIC